MYRSHNCGELRIGDVGRSVTLAGWVQKARKMGGISFIDIRDRYGITQLRVDESCSVSVAGWRLLWEENLSFRQREWLRSARARMTNWIRAT